MISRVYLFAVFALMPSFAFAEAIYPPPPDIRPEGMQQGSVGSCMAEAETAAMENAFRLRGMAVTVSSYHAHAFNWRDAIHQLGIYQEYAADDVALFNHFGRFIPRYMLPEDGRGFYHGATDRPAVSELGVYDFEFPSAAQTGQGVTDYFFIPGYSNSVGVEQLKQFVREQKAVTISIQGGLFTEEVYNWQTGLMARPYAPKPVVKNDRSLDVNHAVALVGFDDELVAAEGAAPGAFIIRNSWNENEKIYSRAFIYDPSALMGKDRQEFYRMRAKINPAKVDVGYFAVPYQYISHLASQGDGGARVFSIDFQAFYNAYTQFKNRYEVRALPYFCDTRSQEYILNQYTSLLAGLRGTDMAKKKMAMTALTALSSRRLQTRGDWPGLRVARIAQSKSKSRVTDFYQGKFADYYCARPGSEFGPDIGILSKPDFQSALQLLDTDWTGLGTWLATYKSIYNYLGENK
jgi:hypothetical protein